MKPGVSIIIACYNSEKIIGETLEYISKLDTSGICVELLIVDNNSKDNTYEFCELFCRQHITCDFTILKESRPGRDNAIATGILAAKLSYILTCDDDNYLAEDYVKVAYGIMEKNPKIGVLGGVGEPIFQSSPPEWAQQGFACGPQGAESGDVTNNRGWVYGACSVYQTNVLRKILRSGFKYNLGTLRSKHVDLSGEDVELCYALKFLGYRIWYSSSLQFKHIMPERRLKTDRFFALRRGDGVQEFALGLYLLIFKLGLKKMPPLLSVKYYLAFLHGALLGNLSFSRKQSINKVEDIALREMYRYKLITALNIFYCFSVVGKIKNNLHALSNITYE